MFEDARKLRKVRRVRLAIQEMLSGNLTKSERILITHIEQALGRALEE